MSQRDCQRSGVLTLLDCPKDYASLPPDLIALSSLTLPSPVSSPAGLNTSWSWSDIPIEFDLDRDDKISSPLLLNSCAMLSSHATGSPGILCSPSTAPSALGTRDTFGGRYAIRHSGSLSPTLQYFKEPLTSNLTKDTSFDTPNLLSPLTPQHPGEKSYGTITDESNVAFDGTMHSSPLRRNSQILCINSADAKLYQTPPKLSALSTSQTKASSGLWSPLTLDDRILPFKKSSPLLASATALVSLEGESLSAPSSPQNCRILPGLLGSEEPYSLPQYIEWLQKIAVELLIDQEGFRTVLARFKYMKYTGEGSRSGNSVPELVQFRPTQKQAFLFHYAPLDGLPVLRRISINGEETRDYISRQASLGLKANGVYFVSGTELPSFPATHGHRRGDNIKLQWRFEYAVDDKGDPGSNRKLDNGEKIVIPLSFSCSPLLLHPLQGKKVRLMQVVKKSVTAKLTAQRMTLDSSRLNLFSQVEEVKHTTQPAFAHLPEETEQVSGLQGAISHWEPEDNIGKDGQEVARPLPSSIAAAGKRISDHDARSFRRRRASSAGELGHFGASSYTCLPPVVDLPLCGNIIPPSHLISLMEAEDNLCNKVPRTSSVLSSRRDSLPFHPLAPRPRHHKAHVI